MNEQSRIPWLSGAQFLLSLLGTFSLGFLSLILFSTAVFANISGLLPWSVSRVESLLIISSALFFGAIVLLPSTMYAFHHLRGKELVWHFPWQRLKWLLLIYLLMIGLGFFAASHREIGQYLLPLAHIFANGSIVFWLIYMGWRNLPPSSPQRFWGIFHSGLFLAPMLSLLTEIFIFLLFSLGWGLHITQNPESYQQLLSYLEQFTQTIATPEIVNRLIKDYLFKPGVLWTAFLYVGLLIPLVEEFIKSIGLWFLIHRKLTPREGFLLGLLGGIGYALSENLLLASDAETWAWVLIPRLGATVVHMLTAGLMGWGLASAWGEKKYLRLGCAYLASASLHAVWNTLALLTAFTQFSGAAAAFGKFEQRIALAAPFGLMILALGSFFGIIRANSYFQER